MKKYRPSNGTEGCYFTSHWCDICAKDDFDPDADDSKGCPILLKTLMMETDCKDYPEEWVCEDDGSNPRCTAYRHEEYRQEEEDKRTLEELDRKWKWCIDNIPRKEEPCPNVVSNSKTL